MTKTSKLGPEFDEQHDDETSGHDPRRATISASVGNFVEWYDLAAFAYATVAISSQIFPDADASTAMVATFATFAITYVIRPLAGIMWGVVGDRFGRKRILSTTILLMALGTAGIGLLPTYGQVGWAAPALLILCRVVQGVAAGGEFIGAATYVYEMAPPARKARSMSWIQLGTGLSYPAAAGLSLLLLVLLGGDAYDSWGWRVMFLASAPLAIVGFYIRSAQDETPAYKELVRSGDLAARPLRESTTTQWRQILAVGGYVMAYAASGQIMLFYLPSYLTESQGLTATESRIATTAALACFAISIPIFGRLVDQLPRASARLTCSVVFGLSVVPGFALIGRPTFALSVLGVTVIALALGFYYAVAPLTAVEVFPARLRYTAGTLAYNVPVAIAAACVPALATLLVARTDDVMTPAYIGVAASVVGVVAGCALTRFPRPSPENERTSR